MSEFTLKIQSRASAGDVAFTLFARAPRSRFLPDQRFKAADDWHGTSMVKAVSVLFATRAEFYLNPNGPVLWSITLVALIGAGTLSRFSSIPETTQWRLCCILPALMAIACLWTQYVDFRGMTFLGAWYFYKNVYAELDVAWVVAWAFGVAFTLRAWRTNHRVCRGAAVVFAIVFALLFFAMHDTWIDVLELWRL